VVEYKGGGLLLGWAWLAGSQSLWLLLRKAQNEWLSSTTSLEQDAAFAGIKRYLPEGFAHLLD
jgi:hypothetical protein